ncbi:MAG: hypothetical protein Ct9H90mP15_06300 [Candidatus Neomarinimicrobiota bacterium]|nr:MAG: hypothetical protein Ct9H90mP15_06300 [Candidatus Neomarinimicrobiota bacterium]
MNDNIKRYAIGIVGIIVVTSILSKFHIFKSERAFMLLFCLL